MRSAEGGDQQLVPVGFLARFPEFPLVMGPSSVEGGPISMAATMGSDRWAARPSFVCSEPRTGGEQGDGGQERLLVGRGVCAGEE